MGYNVAIDGPAGAGKSTIAKRVAKELGYVYVDTGAMYRALAIYFLNQGLGTDDTEKIAEVCKHAEVTLQYEDGVQQVYLNGENVTSFLREESVGNMASVTSAIPEVRAQLLELQREMARTKADPVLVFPPVSSFLPKTAPVSSSRSDIPDNRN